MANLSVNQIRDLAVQFIKNHPGGVSNADVIKYILDSHPETNRHTARTQVGELPKHRSSEIHKPERGVLAPTESITNQITNLVTPKIKAKEQDFYTPFAEYLQDDLEEVTAARAIGGAGMRTKWGTPDVVGVLRPTTADLIKFPVEIISAEIKVDSNQPVVAFGQATAYRLFSSKSYVVMPDTITPADLGRLEALCMVYGTGLVIFRLDPSQPEFRIRVRAQRFQPDMFYVNDFAKQLSELDSSLFHELFS